MIQFIIVNYTKFYSRIAFKNEVKDIVRINITKGVVFHFY